MDRVKRDVDSVYGMVWYGMVRGCECWCCMDRIGRRIIYMYRRDGVMRARGICMGSVWACLKKGK